MIMAPTSGNENPIQAQVLDFLAWLDKSGYIVAVWNDRDDAYVPAARPARLIAEDYVRRSKSTGGPARRTAPGR
jgi:predicted phosphatase